MIRPDASTAALPRPDAAIDCKPNVLVGFVTERLDRNDGSVGKRTITWVIGRNQE